VDVCRFVFPFMIVQFVVVLLVTYLPWISTAFIPAPSP
jgi:TRAP-type C4-dicarboxylate transport system permease large subunit